MTISRDERIKLDKEFCGLILKSGSLSEEDTSHLINNIQVHIDAGLDNVSRSVLASAIIDDNKPDLGEDEYVHHISDKLNTVLDDNNKEFIDNVIDSIEIAILQRNYNYMKFNVNQLETQVRDAMSALNNSTKRIYADFITILGIFTAITFAVFGGMNFVTAEMSKLETGKYAMVSIGEKLIIASVSGLILYGIIVTLFLGISKLSNVEKYEFSMPFVYIVMAVLAILFSTGLGIVWCNK